MQQYSVPRDPQQNDRHVRLLQAMMAVLLGLTGWLLAAAWGLLAALVTVAVMAHLAPRASAAVVMRMYGGRPLGPDDIPGLYGYMAVLSTRAGLEEIPALFYIPSRTLNAFALGRDGEAAIAVTDGLLQRVPSRELVAIMAHEMAHIAHDDLQVMGLADLYSRLTVLLSYSGQLLLLVAVPLWLLADTHPPWLAILLLIAAPWFSALLQLAMSRSREYAADAAAAHLTGDPEGLAVALARLDSQLGARNWLGVSHRDPNPSLLRSHPNTAERIRRLATLTEVPPGPPVAVQHAPPIDYPPVSHAPRRRITGLWH